MKEYGSNIQKLVEHLQTIEDREKRTRYAHILVELMRQIHPNMRDNQDYYNKLWDDLYIMSGFKLDVDSPYPPPTADVLGKKPQPVPYNTHGLRYKHYGQNINLLIAKAISLEDSEERLAFVSYMAKLMKTFYSTWNKEAVEDETILTNLDEMANGKLHADIMSIRTNGFVDATPRERTGDQPPRRTPSGPSHGRNEGSAPSHGRHDGSGQAYNRNETSGNRQNNPNFYPNQGSRGHRDGGAGGRDNRDGGHRNDRFRGGNNPNNRKRR
ncbi:DUF4290 domain-containing protein [Larkinella sp. C7]|uniref:DUF4290 domain-containing protein n=1 Tax=Larkinella sp. C7 TaxID=2576607 RepID=UPI0011111CD8|nr:DUF4290 domain-containing protein [Larkinella sp. C7]